MCTFTKIEVSFAHAALRFMQEFWAELHYSSGFAIGVDDLTVGDNGIILLSSPWFA